MTRRFDSPELVEHWQATGHFPVIHDAIFQAVKENLKPGTRVLDLGACTGLLSRRMADAGYTVTAVEPDLSAWRQGDRAGTFTDIPVHTAPINTMGLFGFEAMLGERRIEAIVARRVFPEIHSAMRGDWHEFMESLNSSAVETIILEGRKHSTRTVHPLGHVAKEIAALGEAWELTQWQGEVAVLERRAA